MHATQYGRWSMPAAVLSGVLALSGCAGSGGAEPGYVETALSRASTAIAVASTAEADRYAAPELAIAREKLASARQTARAENYAAADRLVSECLVNVQLATAKAEAGRVQAAVRRLKASLPPSGAAPGGSDGASRAGD